MLCPYCSVEMEKGFIQSPHELLWTKEPVWSFWKRSRRSLPKGSVVLGEAHFFASSSVTAWLCRKCRKILIDPTDGTGL